MKVSKNKLLIPIILIVLAIAVVAVVLVLTLGGGNENEGSTQTDQTDLSASSTTEEPQGSEEQANLALRFAEAVLTCNKDEITACVHRDMAEEFCLRYGENEVVFTNCKLTLASESTLLKDGLELYTSSLYRDYGIRANVESGTIYTVDFTATYNSKEYSGSMEILSADFDGGTFIISVELTQIEDAFYEDNFPAGDYYFDMHGEE